jgi:hypothetical protein
VPWNQSGQREEENILGLIRTQTRQMSNAFVGFKVLAVMATEGSLFS